MTNSQHKIAFIGLGIMGSPMAVHLANAGHQVAGFDPNPQKAEPLYRFCCRPRSSRLPGRMT